jgi:UDP:flavonoid glycosyltransferase YjiC (YdhE family)
MLPLGQELLRRGHRVTFVGFLDAQARTEAAGLEFRAIGESKFPTHKTLECFQAAKGNSASANKPNRKRNAVSLQEAIHQAGGATQAAEIIEQAVQTVEPVLAESSR